MHQAAEIFEPKTEYVYKFLQVWGGGGGRGRGAPTGRDRERSSCRNVWEGAPRGVCVWTEGEPLQVGECSCGWIRVCAHG